MSLPEVAVVSAVRSPIGKFGGSLADYTPGDLGALALKEALGRASVAGNEVGEVFFGQARQAGGGPNVARQVVVKAGLPVEVPACTINQACGSGLRSIFLGAEAVMLGRSRIVAVGGVESMSRVPYLLDRARWGYRLGNAEVVDGMYRDGFHCPLCDRIMGETAETLAQQYKISREAQDAFAAASQNKAEAARKAGRFDAETFEVPPAPKSKAKTSLIVDEHPRDGVTADALGKLPPVFGGTVTAGNASGITDGAAALVLMAREEAEKRGLAVMGILRRYSTIALDPAVMGLGAALAAKKVLEAAEVKPDALDAVEVNEAFAAQVLACQELYPLPMDRTNLNGGSIALGHPIGCTGARIVVTLLHALAQRDGKLGLATLCVSGGMGLAALFERPGRN
ncbi:MAG: thiolase family protein [Armatimonadetes bacterium]|nr:thiolase family protein [Armatimonadota bacterium]